MPGLANRVIQNRELKENPEQGSKDMRPKEESLKKMNYLRKLNWN